MPVGHYNLNCFFGSENPYGRTGILIAMGVVIAFYVSETFMLGAWVTAPALFVFALD